MKFGEIAKKLKPSQWYHWVAYGTLGSMMASGIVVGVVFGVKKNDEVNSQNNGKELPQTTGDQTKKGGSTGKKQGSQAGLPKVTSKSIDVKKL